MKEAIKVLQSLLLWKIIHYFFGKFSVDNVQQQSAEVENMVRSEGDFFFLK